MKREREKTLQALKTAIQMEIDGKEFYIKASRESKSELGRKLLKSLSSEEDYHRRKFEEIYSSIERKMGWPKTDFHPGGGKKLRTVFSRATGEISTEKDSLSTEINTVQKAMDMESESREFYIIHGENAVYAAEREFYEILAAEEKEHFLILLDYFEYLKDPAGWFVANEHPSLDGG